MAFPAARKRSLASIIHVQNWSRSLLWSNRTGDVSDVSFIFANPLQFLVETLLKLGEVVYFFFVLDCPSFFCCHFVFKVTDDDFEKFKIDEAKVCVCLSLCVRVPQK